MKLILDTANLDDIKYFNTYYPISGVTTNPTILSREGGDIVKICGIKNEFHFVPSYLFSCRSEWRSYAFSSSVNL